MLINLHTFMAGIWNLWVAGGLGSGAALAILVLALPFGQSPLNGGSNYDDSNALAAENAIQIYDEVGVSLKGASESGGLQGVLKDTALFCDMPEAVEENSAIPVLWRLTDLTTLGGIEEKTVVMTVVDSDAGVRAVTGQDGYASAELDLAGLEPGKYLAYGFFDADSSYRLSSCEREIEILAHDEVESELDEAAGPFSENDPTLQNAAPTAMDDSARTRVNTSVLIDVLENDVDADNDILEVIAISNPGNGSVVDEGQGLVRYIPNANFVGADAFSYTISDGRGAESVATVSVTVFRSSGSSSLAPACTDATPPQLQIMTPLQNSITAGPSNGVLLLVEGTTSDNPDGCGFDKVQVAIFNQDSGQVTRWYRQADAIGAGPDVWSEWSYQFKVYEEASYRIVARALDSAGNIKWFSATTEVVFDSDATQPKVTIASPTNGDTVSVGTSLTATITGTSFDAMSGIEKVEVRTGDTSYQMATPISTGDWSEWTHVRTFNASGGQILVARSTDGAGNMGWFVIEVVLA